MLGARFFQAMMKGDLGAAIVILIAIIIKTIFNVSDENKKNEQVYHMWILYCSIILLFVIILYFFGGNSGKTIAKEFDIQSDGMASCLGCSSVICIALFILLFMISLV